MFSAQNKIHKDKGVAPTEFEERVAQAFFDLENTNQELKSDLKDLYINQAVSMDIAGNRKAVVIYVPFRLRKAFRKIHPRLVRELEKKFSGKVLNTFSPFFQKGVYMEPKERNNTEYKLETMVGVYRKLTGKDVVFEYPVADP
ncbi:BnaA01g32880D [Brassica napus]|uniref:40S ribosomal protein S7 n=1 Tax=Brassica napus TaxID=3708 RepID=A0A078HAI1_BRANA|nr:BnaA01g32880D [Brassica napus]